MKINLFEQLKKLQSGQSQGVNPFGDEKFKTSENQPFNKQLEGISPVAKEQEPEFDLSNMSMELENNSFDASSNNDEEKKKQQLLAQMNQ